VKYIVGIYVVVVYLLVGIAALDDYK